MINDAYSYLFHCSDYRDTDTKWACFRREDDAAYWSGSTNRWGNARNPIITYGKTPDDAWDKMKQLNEQLADV